jgi:hypothetical protein
MSDTNTVLYRSKGLRSGTFRQVGVLHMHIDGAGYQNLINSLVQQLEAGGARVKLTAVTQALAGPQRAEEVETYASHTPTVDDHEHLEYFSSSSLHNREDAVRTLGVVIPRVSGHEGVVIEVERVVAKMDDSGWQAISVREAPITGAEVGFVNRASLPFEIHHAIDFEATASSKSRPPITLSDLLVDMTAAGLKVGGWFTFLKGEGHWSFRSNAFTDGTDLEALVRGQHQLLKGYLADRQLLCNQWAIVEHVVGIWRSPFDRVLE